MLRAVLTLTLLVLTTLPVTAKRTVHMEDTMKLRLELEQLTTIVLPERISSATTALKKEVLMVGEDGAVLTIVPLHPGIPPGRLVVVGEQTGTVYLLFYELVASRGDDLVSITRGAPAKKVEATPITLMRALLAHPTQPLRLPGVTASSPTAFLPVPPPDETRLVTGTAQLETVNGTLHALRVELLNTQDIPLVLDHRVGERPDSASEASMVHLTRWAWPPRQDIAVLYVEHDLVPPRGTTMLYVIYEER